VSPLCTPDGDEAVPPLASASHLSGPSATAARSTAGDGRRPTWKPTTPGTYFLGRIPFHRFAALPKRRRIDPLERAPA